MISAIMCLTLILFIHGALLREAPYLLLIKTRLKMTDLLLPRSIMIILNTHGIFRKRIAFRLRWFIIWIPVFETEIVNDRITNKEYEFTNYEKPY